MTAKETIRRAIEEARESEESVVQRLAQKSPIEFDRVREAEAKKLGIRKATLDAEVARARNDGRSETPSGGSTIDFLEIQPWPSLVDGGELLSEIAATIRRHVMLSDVAADATALWVAHAHLIETSGISPILAVTSAAPACGKTTLLTILGSLVPKPLSASNITSAAIFRTIERCKPTLLIDEADTFLKDNEELRGVLNSGHNRAAAFVVRLVGDDHEPRKFSTWAPKVIALIGKLPATLESRAVHVELRRLAPGETVEPLRADRLGFLEPLTQKLVRWTEDVAAQVHCADPAIPDSVNGRSRDNWRHLIAIADAAGEEWSRRARTAAGLLTASDQGQTLGIALLQDIQTIFMKIGVDRLRSSEVAGELGGMEDRPWTDWRQGKPISAAQIARQLSPFKVRPQDFKFDGSTAKGYAKSQFEDAWLRYLGPHPDTAGATTQLSCDCRDLDTSGTATATAEVAGRNPDMPLSVNKSCGVADCGVGASWKQEI